MSWVALGTAAVSAGGSYLASKYSGGDGGGDGGGSGGGIGQSTRYGEPFRLPDYQESEGARASWWDTLQKWGSQPGYGAIQPNWDDIWNNARGKVSRYFGGGPEGPGVNARVAANSAKRGVADQAAGDAMLQRSFFQEGNMLQDLAVQQAMKEAEIGEGGRKDWMSSLMGLAKLSPNYASGRDSETFQEIVPADIGSPGGGLFDLLGSFYNNQNAGEEEGGVTGISTGDTGIGDVKDGGTDLMLRLLPQLVQMFAR